MRKFLSMTVVIAAISLSLGSSAYSTNPVLSINIDNPKFRPLKIAIPSFGTDAEANKARTEMARLMEFTGLFKVVPESAYQDIAKNIGAAATTSGLTGVNLPQWKGLGVEALIVGQVKKDGSGLDMAFKTIDGTQQQVLVGKRFQKVPHRDLITVVRRFADYTIEAFTGKSGIFNSKMVFVGRKQKGQNKQIYMADFDGGNVQQVSKGDYIHITPAWSPDGKFITYTSYQEGQPNVFIYDVRTKRSRRLSTRAGTNGGSSWSHNGSFVAFTGARGGDTDLFYVLPSGGRERTFIMGEGLDVDPAFSPDGKYLAFVSGRYGNPHIFVSKLNWRTDGSVGVSEDKRLTFAGWYNTGPDWSPASDKIIFAGYDKEIDRYDLFIMNPDGSQLERLTLKTGDNEDPSWAPNGQMIAFHSNRIGASNTKDVAHLYVMHRDGSNQRKIETGMYESTQPDWGPNIIQ